jgi:hypothetical protein
VVASRPGTVLRPGQLQTYARDAGCGDVEILAIDNDFWRFYRLWSAANH